ncbi:hypothetical protein COOONC_23119, partial [Cooperia oncophora]
LWPSIIQFVAGTTTALICLQCNGWQGDYPLRSTNLNTCNNLNNQCQTDFFCVKITDPMRPGTSYSTYKADCWSQDTLAVTPTNTTAVSSGQCYDYRDASVPPKRSVNGKQLTFWRMGGLPMSTIPNLTEKEKSSTLLNSDGRTSRVREAHQNITFFRFGDDTSTVSVATTTTVTKSVVCPNSSPSQYQYALLVLPLL